MTHNTAVERDACFREPPTLLPGRDMDARVAERVLGWRWQDLGPDYDGKNAGRILVPPDWSGLCVGWPPRGRLHPAFMVPRCSTDLSDAWRLVEHLRQAGWLVIIKTMPDGFPFLGPHDRDPQPQIYRRSVCSLQWIPTKGAENTRRSIGMHPLGVGESVPEAICRCALDMADLVERWEKRE